MSDTQLKKRLPTILLAEDDEDAVFLMKKACSKSRLMNPIQIVADGQETMDYLEGARAFADRARFPVPTLLLLDLKMPKLDGFQVLARVRSNPVLKSLPIVVLTNSQHPGDIERAYDLGVNSFAVKPTGIDNLVELLNRLEGWWIGANLYPTAKS